MAGLSTIATIAGLAGTALQFVGTIRQGQEAAARHEYEQKVQEQQADEARAASQRAAAARKREGDILLSRQRAAVAASGGSTADQSVLDIMGETAKESDLAVRTELFKGEQQGRGYDDAAIVSGIDAKNAVTSSYFSAAGGLFSGISSMYSRFGQQQSRTRTAPVMIPYG